MAANQMRQQTPYGSWANKKPQLRCQSMKTLPQQHLQASASKLRVDINLDERRLASADRNNKATLLLTALPRTIKSSAKDLSQRKVKLQYVGVNNRAFPQKSKCQPDTVRGQRPILIQLQCAGKHHRFLAWILT